MSHSGENIRRNADLMRQEEHIRRSRAALASQQADFTELANLQHVENLKTEIPRLCACFAVWASSHDIPYNSPSPLAPGWLLGRGEGPPSYGVSHQGIQVSGSSSYSLLVRSTGIVKELVTHNVYRRRFKHHFFARSAKLKRYSVASVENSIAEFSAKYNTPWID